MHYSRAIGTWLEFHDNLWLEAKIFPVHTRPEVWQYSVRPEEWIYKLRKATIKSKNQSLNVELESFKYN